MDLEQAREYTTKILKDKIARKEIPNDGARVIIDSEEFVCDWCGLDVEDIFDEYVCSTAEDEHDLEAMDDEEAKQFIDSCLKVFKRNLIVYDPNADMDGGIGLGDLSDYEIVD